MTEQKRPIFNLGVSPLESVEVFVRTLPVLRKTAENDLSPVFNREITKIVPVAKKYPFVCVDKSGSVLYSREQLERANDSVKTAIVSDSRDIQALGDSLMHDNERQCVALEVIGRYLTEKQREYLETQNVHDSLPLTMTSVGEAVRMDRKFVSKAVGPVLIHFLGRGLVDPKDLMDGWGYTRRVIFEILDEAEQTGHMYSRTGNFAVTGEALAELSEKRGRSISRRTASKMRGEWQFYKQIAGPKRTVTSVVYPEKDLYHGVITPAEFETFPSETRGLYCPLNIGGVKYDKYVFRDLAGWSKISVGRDRA